MTSNIELVLEGDSLFFSFSKIQLHHTDTTEILFAHFITDELYVLQTKLNYIVPKLFHDNSIVELGKLDSIRIDKVAHVNPQKYPGSDAVYYDVVIIESRKEKMNSREQKLLNSYIQFDNNRYFDNCLCDEPLESYRFSRGESEYWFSVFDEEGEKYLIIDDSLNQYRLTYPMKKFLKIVNLMR